MFDSQCGWLIKIVPVIHCIHSNGEVPGEAVVVSAVPGHHRGC